MELTNGIFTATGKIYKNNRGSSLRTVINTNVHLVIAIKDVMLF